MTSLPGSTLRIALQNHSSSDIVFGYITGRAIDENNALFLLESDGKTHHYPASPSSILSKLERDVAIPLGAPGKTIEVDIPHIAGGRIWFSYDRPLTFLLNPGPALVEPSVTNQTDPNIDINWGFCEFTFNSAQLFANISYVDFVSLPISLTLTNTAGAIQNVAGMPENGLATICAGLRAQTEKDSHPWSSLIATSSGGRDLRALSPNNGSVTNPSWFSSYWADYVEQVWEKYAQEHLRINTQAAFGIVSGKVPSSKNAMQFSNDVGEFDRPCHSDIFSCSTGPFATGASAPRNAVIPRIAAAFNRSTLLLCAEHPNGACETDYYQHDTTNHYSRIVHEANLDGRGYAFPYDDVNPDGGADQAGVVHDGSPKLFTVAVGGRSAHT